LRQNIIGKGVLRLLFGFAIQLTVPCHFQEFSSPFSSEAVFGEVSGNAMCAWLAEMQSNFFHQVGNQCLYRWALEQSSSGNRTAM